MQFQLTRRALRQVTLILLILGQRGEIRTRSLRTPDAAVYLIDITR